MSEYTDERMRETLASLTGCAPDRIAAWQLVNDNGQAVVQVRLTPEVEVIDLHVRAALPEPEPEPEWRSRVEEWGSNPQRAFKTPLSCVLHLMSRIDNDTRIDHDPNVPATALLDDLARIVAVCERELVGDGWRAKVADNFGQDAWSLMYAFTINDETASPACWQNLGYAAAYWLATLTGEAS